MANLDSAELILSSIADGSIKDILRSKTLAGGARELQAETSLDLRHAQIAVSLDRPAPRNWIVDGLLLAGKPVVLGGFGGVSKTQLAIQLSVSVALGAPFSGQSVKAGKTLLISGEEDLAEIERRVSAIARKREFYPQEIDRVEQNLKVFGLVGRDVRLSARESKSLLETAFATEIIRLANQIGELRLIIFDHMALLHGGDFNAREDAALTMRILNKVAKETGAAVLVLAHTPKSALERDQSDASMVAGSTAFVDQARGAFILASMRREEAKRYGVEEANRGSYVSLTVVKNNYGPSDRIFWFRRMSFDNIGLLEPVTLIESSRSPKKAEELENRIIGFIGAHPGQYSKTRLREMLSGKSGPLKASKAVIEATIEMLISSNRLVNRAPTKSERDKFGHGPRVTHVIDVPIKGGT
jgi:RecA-family ATPase